MGERLSEPRLSTGLVTLLTEELTNRGHEVRLHVSGDSMHPAIRGGDRIIVVPLDGELPRRGEILLFRSRRGLTAHRVIEDLGSNRWRTRGDNASQADEPVRLGEILGRVVRIERAGRQSPAIPSDLSSLRACVLLAVIASRRLIRHEVRHLRGHPG